MSWESSVQNVGKWYEANIHNYNQGQYSPCPVPLCGTVRHDCSGFVSACLRAEGVIKTTQTFRSGDYLQNGAAAPLLKKAGFTPLPYNINLVQPYDIIAYNGHVEIYAGKSGNSMRSWSWGSCHDGRNGHIGMPAYMSKKNYAVMWRKGGVSTAFSGFSTPWNTGQWTGNNKASANTNEYGFPSSTVDQSVFTSAINNQFTPSSNIVASSPDPSQHRTRIYSALNPTITVDELSISMNEGGIGDNEGG